MKKILFISFLTLQITASFSQSCHDVKELLRKRHTISGMNYGHPYTMFDRHNGYALDSMISNIRLKFKKDTIVRNAYQKIYTNATKPRPLDDGKKNGDGYSALAIWAKNNAFVFLIGLDSVGNLMDSTDTTYYKRNTFRDRAKGAFNYLDGAIPSYIPLYNSDDHNMQHYSRSLIYWLQAYDLLKAAYEVSELRNAGRNPWGFGDADRNTDGDCGVRRRLRDYARNIYRRSEGIDGIVEHATGWKKNHGIACASSLLMAAQVLNDAGTETNFFVGVWGSIKNWFGSEEVEYAPKYSPINWNELGQSGLYDNLFVGNHWNFFGLLADDVPQAYPSKIKIGGIMLKVPFPIDHNPYAEGPGYANYGLFDCGIPAMIAQKNLYPDWSDEPFLKDTAILAIYDWYYKLQTDDNMQPSYDNSTNEANSILGITGIRKYNRGIEGINENLLADYVAMVGGNNIPLNKDLRAEFDVMKIAGNAVVRSRRDSSNHTFHVLFEEGNAIDKAATYVDESHEDDDMGSFLFYASDKYPNVDNSIFKNVPLAIDPPYFSHTLIGSTNKYWMHNTIEINDANNVSSRVYKNPKINIIDDGGISKINKFDLTFDFKNEDHHLYGDVITRSFNVINGFENFYYIVNDFVDAKDVEDFSYLSYTLNGNGNQYSNDSFGKASFRKEKSGDSLFRWTYPCMANYNSWGLTAQISVLNNDTNDLVKKVRTTLHTYSNDGGNSTKANGVAGGTLTRLKIHQSLRKTIFQSFLYPQKCNWPLPKVTKEETTDHVLTRIYFVNALDTSQKVKFGKANIVDPNKTINDTASHFHFARWEGGIADSVTNPFNLPAHSNIKLYLDAKKAFVKHNTYAENMQGYKYCPSSFINTRYASIENGSYLKYNDTFLIKSTIQADISMGFFRRQEYTCTVTPLSTPSSADSIQFYLADVGRGVEMIALTQSTDTLPSRYDSLTRMMYVKMPAVKTTFFLQEKESCKNCYFPQTWLGVVEPFTVDNETYNKLGTKLTVKQPNGLLKVTKSSSITMCEGVYLQNKDSIIIEGPCQTKAYERKMCKGIDSMVAAYSENSAIVVSPFSALVLEPGSYTYVKNGGAIYVKANGSLIIKAGAFVQMGDSGTCNQGWGEIIAEPGAYVHIEPDAHIEYRRTIGDTVDRNMFIIPSASGLAKANEGVQYAMKTILQNDTILPSPPLAFFTYPICGLDTTTPIINREWGYTNFGKPYATFQARKDTLCPGEPLHIKLNRILNDARYKITVCRMDSILIRDIQTGSNYWVDTCLVDTIVQDTIYPDPVCKEPRNTPEDWTYYFNPGTLHRVTIEVWNDCGDLDDSIAYIYTALPPDVTINVPETACEGFGTLNASVSVIHNQVYNYALEITEKLDTSSITYKKGALSETYSKSYNGLLPSTINFNDYFFKGGSTYLISLTISNDCGTYSVYDSVTIPLGAGIKLTRPTAFASPITGATSVQLIGTVLNADSFRWEPNIWLDNATVLNPISTPTDSITYVLIAKGGACTATDTAHIKYNRYANAGYSDTLCLDSTHETETLIGFPYDMSLFLGMLYHYNPTEFMSIYTTYNTGNAQDYFRYFTHFMHDNEFEPLAAGPCAINLYNFFVNTVDKQQFFGKKWFRDYYKSFTQFSDPSIPAFDNFNTSLASDPVLYNYFTGLADWNSFNPSCVEEIIKHYNDYRASRFNEITTTWSKITGNDTTNLTSWNNYFVAVDAPAASSKYILSVITPNRAEIDEITILVDTILTPLFAPALQFDSTVFFMNYTEPISNATTYEWNFGDGSANSFEQNPVHTFPAFDSNYVVCLTASNKCNLWQYCDTVWIDSLHLGGTLKTVNKPAFFETNTSNNAVSKQAASKAYQLSPENIQLSNYPNPFNQSTIIDYEIWQSFNHAELRITNVLGQVLYTQKLQKPIDKVEIDGSNLANGLYYYSIVVDNSIKLTKTMSVIH